MNAQYRFKLLVGGTWHDVHPVWKDDLALEYKRESGQMFMRQALSASIDFIREDYTLIMSATFGTAFYLNIEISTDGGSTWAVYHRARFYVTDCTINVDQQRITVKPDGYDKYNKILAGMDKEYDLIKLKPAIESVQMMRRPLMQIYTKGENIVSCFLGGMSWEQDTTTSDATDEKLLEDYHFGKIGEFVQIAFGDNPPAGLTTPMTGIANHGDSSGEWADFSNGDGVYYMTYFQEYVAPSESRRDCTNGLRIKRISDNVEIWNWSQTRENYGGEIIYDPIPASFTFGPSASGYSDVAATSSTAAIYGRWLLAKQFTDASEIPADDIVANNRNYRYCYPYVGNIIKMTDRSSASPTEWGRRPDGRYYMKPTLTPDEMLVIDAQYPVARSTWGMASIWLQWSAGLGMTESTYRTPTILRDAYTLEAVISALLAEIDSTISFSPMANYSEFLYGINPMSNDWGRLFITPKSNIMVAEYSQPAQKAPITLKDVLDMLRKACGLYWFIDSNNRLRIEHISWFKNGGTYSGSPSVGINLTTMENPRNGKMWSFGTSEYKYDKVEMAERYQFDWMDDTTVPFKGEAIDVLSPYVEEGNIEEETIAMFNSDVDYIMLDPSSVSKDGFALMCARLSSGIWTLQFEHFQIEDNFVEMQNYHLSMTFLQPKFLISDMPAWNIRVNGGVTTALGIQRKKTQQVSVPTGNSDPNTSLLVRTGVGDGEIKQMSVKLTSRMAKMTLIYDTN